MKRNLSKLLERSLPEARLNLLRLLAHHAAMLRMPLYLVGGVVRDLLLGGAVNDFDLVVEGDAIKLARSLVALHGGRVTVHPRFGTAKWFLPENLRAEVRSSHTLDLISARSETYRHPAALPTVKPGRIEDDIRRRDFTINALAIRLDEPHFGELRDDVGGADDLRQGIVRVLHPGSFIDDPTRMYRAVRYEKRYGFKIARETLALIPEARPFVSRLSAQRIRHELDLILDEENAVSMLKRLDALDLLEAVHPALAGFDRSRLAALRPDRLPADRNLRWLLWLMHLPGREIERLNERLHFTARLMTSLRAASALYARLDSFGGLKPSQFVERMEAYPLDAVQAVSAAISDPRIRYSFHKYLSDWRHLRPKITGHDLKKRGIEPGPVYAQILQRLRAAWLDGEVKTEEEERRLLESLL